MKVLALLFGLILASMVHAQDNFPDVPENHAVFRALAHLKAEGLLIKSALTNDGLRHNGPTKLSDLIDVTVNSIKALPGVLDARIQALEAIQKAGKLEYPASSYRADAEAYVKEIPGYFALVLRTIAPNFVELALTLKSCEPKFQRIAELSRAIAIRAGLTFQFPDVPQKHWAAAAIQELRDQKILTGYPDGKFRGGN